MFRKFVPLFLRYDQYLMNEILQSILDQFATNRISKENLIALQLVIGAMLVLYYIVGKRLLTFFYKRGTITEVDSKKLRNIVRLLFFLITLIIAVVVLGLNIGVPNASSTLNVINTLFAILIIQIARLADYLFGRIFTSFYKDIDQEEENTTKDRFLARPERKATQTLKYAIYNFAIILILKNFQIDYELFTFQAGGTDYHFRISSIFTGILILLIARLIVWGLTQVFLRSYYKSRQVDIGSQYAINQIISYIVYIIAFVMALDNMGIQMTVLWGGIAALLVGVGLGLQQTFNDLFSGILLLFERTVEVGDVVEINGIVGTVKTIGLRTSLIEARDSVTHIIPNSKLVMDNIVNWNHYDSKVRFSINVGVAYGSDTALVKKLLLQAIVQPKVLKRPAPFIRFSNFGDSSLDFEIMFYSRDLRGINDVKSDVRFEIDRLFRENGIEIPFPQRDVWMRSEKK